MYDNNIDAGVFEFLDTPAKIILANILPLIDPLNDFLKEQNHSNAAQIFVSDIIAQIGQNNLTAVTSSDLTALFPYSADVTAFLTAHPQNPQAQRALLTMANVSAQGWLTGPYPDSQRDAIIALYNFPDPEMYSEFILNCAYLKKQNPNRSNYLIGAEAYLMTISGYVHTLFDICGLVPLGGELCDLANGVLYVIEGDGVNATLSFAATIPVVGWVATGAKYAKVAVKITGTQTTKILKITHAGGGSLTFGARTTLRTVMNITDAANDAHHIIPWGKQSHSLVQHAAKADNIPYHMNHVKNGKEIKRFRFDQPDGIHANHPQYDANVEAKMAEVWQDLVDDFGGEANIPVNEASQRLRDLQNFIGSKIDANPNTKINDLQF